jgi:hypothetical protein
MKLLKCNELLDKYALNFIFGGKSHFTIANKDTGNQFSFKIIQSDNSPSIFYVNIKNRKDIDPVTNSTYVYGGFIVNKDNEMKYYQGAGGKMSEKHQSVRALMYVLKHLQKEDLPLNVSVYHVGKCGHCGRKLTDAHSIEIGLGKDCAHKLGVQY